jgi:hypothetical protein
MWQMDFKGHFATEEGRCHPLTVLDDHSRYCVGLQACADEQGTTVQNRLTSIFRRYGLPRRMLMDNGPPWRGDGSRWTPLTVWLMRLGVGVCHGRPYHPQTQGKDERFHRTLDVELLQGRPWASVAACQEAFDPWRSMYNLRRPHEALGLATPGTRYTISLRVFPETLPPIEYGPNDIVRKVQGKGRISFRHGLYWVGRAFRGYRVGLRPTERDGVLAVFFAQEQVATVDLIAPHDLESVSATR